MFFFFFFHIFAFSLHFRMFALLVADSRNSRVCRARALQTPQSVRQKTALLSLKQFISNILDDNIIKGSWEAIFRVTDDFYLMKGGVRLYIT